MASVTSAVLSYTHRPLTMFLPHHLYLFLSTLAAFIVSYYLFSPWYSTSKQKAWVLTAISSFVMTCSSLPYVWDYIAGGASLQAIRPTSNLANYGITVFQAYLAADLIMGTLHYRDQINLLSGWIHHVLYIYVVNIAISRSWAHIFSFCASMELPTFIMALGCMHPNFRSDFLFAATFFATRIVFNISTVISCLKLGNRTALFGGSFIPAGILSCAFSLHALWFTKCIQGNIRRYRLRMAAKKSEKVDAKQETTQILESDVLIRSDAPRPSSVILNTSVTVLTQRTEKNNSESDMSASCPELPDNVLDEATLVKDARIAEHLNYDPRMPIRPWTFPRRRSFDKARQTLQTVQNAHLELIRAMRKIQESGRFREFHRAGRNVYDRVYDRLPDQQALFDYVGLNGRARETAVY